MKGSFSELEALLWCKKEHATVVFMSEYIFISVRWIDRDVTGSADTFLKAAILVRDQIHQLENPTDDE